MPETEPIMVGRKHWLAAERNLDEYRKHGDPFFVEQAKVHALLALSASAYGFHVEPFRPEGDSPHKGKDEGPNQ